VAIPAVGLHSWSMAAVLSMACLAAACGSSSTSPSRGAIVTFQVADEIFRVLLLDEAQVEAARRAQAGSPARIPNGRIVAGTDVNTGYSWHLEDVTFAEATIELCDGRPSDVEQEGVQFGGGRFCPWSAQIRSLVAR
jgi:hypothetical protein